MVRYIKTQTFLIGYANRNRNRKHKTQNTKNFTFKTRTREERKQKINGKNQDPGFGVFAILIKVSN